MLSLSGMTGNLFRQRQALSIPAFIKRTSAKRSESFPSTSIKMKTGHPSSN
jgi:hypothetical protein